MLGYVWQIPELGVVFINVLTCGLFGSGEKRAEISTVAAWAMGAENPARVARQLLSKQLANTRLPAPERTLSETAMVLAFILMLLLG